MKYSYSYEVNKLKPLKLALLVIALLLDILFLATIPSMYLSKYAILVGVLLLILSIALKISTLKLTYKIEYSYFREKLLIVKKYYRKEQVMLEVNKKDVVSITEVKNQDNRIVSNYNALFDEVLLNTKENSYILSLDKTMISALLCEEEYDLFR